MAGSSRLDLVVKDDGRPIAPAVRAAMDHLSALEDSLIDRSIAFAKASGYARYTTTIRAAWTEAVRSLTEALGEFLAMPRDGRAGHGAA